MPEITMPQLGETVTEGTITKWFKKVGDKVDQDETLFEVSTDKVDSEVPSSAAGYVAEILVQEGETVDVGVKLAVISEEAPSGAAGGGDEKSEGQAEEPAQEQAEKPEAKPAAKAGTKADAKPEPASEPEPAAKAEPEPAPEPEPAGATASNGPPAGTGNGDGSGGGGGRSGGTRVLSPVVRRLLSEHDLDPSQIEGTGQQGRITRNDVMAHLDRAPQRQAQQAPDAPVAPAPAAAGKQAPAAEAPAAKGDDVEVVPFSNIRRRTAEHMVRSKATSAHVLVAIEVDYENVERVRAPEREQFKADEGFSLTYLPFISRAVIDAIADFPHVNASVGENQLLVHRHVHLGFAVDLSFEGLIVPVVHNADDKRLRPIARELADLAARARARKVTADEISGSTFTITNPGSFGTMITAPVINQPQVAILSTDGIKKRPVVVELPDGTDSIAIHRVGNLAMSFDHRAFDGAYASAFLARVKEIIETRDWSQEL